MVKGQMGLIASDIVEALPESLKELSAISRQQSASARKLKAES
jgi:hypothetical protein